MSFQQVTAAEVRTGDVITTPWAPNRTLTVDYPTRERFTSPEGVTSDVVRFTGMDSFGQHVEKGWGQSADGRVYIVEAAPRDGNTFGALA
ncbi:hypothetical protein ACWKSP_22135 [Micromonosporaceae bacterium Da 78-11]